MLSNFGIDSGCEWNHCNDIQWFLPFVGMSRKDVEVYSMKEFDLVFIFSAFSFFSFM